MNQEAIIRNAAEKANMPYPLDNESQELSESILRSLDEGVKWANGKENNLIKTDIKKWLEDLHKEAEAL